MPLQVCQRPNAESQNHISSIRISLRDSLDAPVTFHHWKGRCPDSQPERWMGAVIPRFRNNQFNLMSGDVSYQVNCTTKFFRGQINIHNTLAHYLTPLSTNVGAIRPSANLKAFQTLKYRKGKFTFEITSSSLFEKIMLTSCKRPGATSRQCVQLCSAASHSVLAKRVRIALSTFDWIVSAQGLSSNSRKVETMKRFHHSGVPERSVRESPAGH
ncbi:hypothetical protein EV401DRAFT_2104724 [Pisolithus croceorrhizus]|nr:hypothetical protein EV401DRAFT_2104724 [Pisolithus croceorrhizus]